MLTMDDKRFYPFYEKIADALPIPVVGKLLISCMLACLFLAPHFGTLSVYSGDAEKIFSRWDWMIGVIIFFAMTFLYYATHTFHNLFPLLDILWKPDEDHQNYLIRINKVLSDRAFLTSAIAFGLLNLSFGLWFGLPDGSNIEKISLCWGYFLIGFVCGLPAWGIYGVIDIIAYLSRAGTFEFEYTSPDGCGGVRFLGDAIIKFSTVTLIVGVLISSYIINTDWNNESLISRFFMWAWIAFPYVLSLLIVMIPSTGINQLLCEFKFKEDTKLKNKLDELLKKK